MSRSIAFTFAVVLLLLSGSSFRRMNANSSNGYQNTIDSEALSTIPLEFPEFSGCTIALDERVRLASDAESVIYRLYRSSSKPFEVSLFAAAGGRPRDLAPHRPEVCYASAGWIRESATEIRVGNGLSVFDARILKFVQPGMPPKRTLVLNYYLVDGDAYPDIDGLRLRVARFGNQIRSWTQVQIATMLEPGEADQPASLALREFAALVAPEIRRATGFGPIMPIEKAKEPGSP